MVTQIRQSVITLTEEAKAKGRDNTAAFDKINQSLASMAEEARAKGQDGNAAFDKIMEKMLERWAALGGGGGEELLILARGLLWGGAKHILPRKGGGRGGKGLLVSDRGFVGEGQDIFCPESEGEGEGGLKVSPAKGWEHQVCPRKWGPLCPPYGRKAAFGGET